MAACKPGPAHARLAEMLGTYETTSRMSMEGAGGKAIETHGTAEISWLVEGRWLALDPAEAATRIRVLPDVIDTRT